MSIYVHDPLDITPQMTSYTAPSPYWCDASAEAYPGFYPAWYAFKHEGLGEVCWIGSGYTNQWLRFYLGGSSYTVNKYRVCGYIRDGGGDSMGPWYVSDWTFQGSNNGSTWTTLDTRSGQIPTEAGIYYNITNTVGYKYYRICPTAGTYGTGPLIGQLELFVPTGWTKKIMGISNPKTIMGIPNDGRIKTIIGR